MATGNIKLPSAEQLIELINAVKDREAVSVNTLPTASLEKELQLVDVIDSASYAQLIVPMGVGYNDGLIYGASKDYKRLVRIANSFETKTNADLEYGQDFTGDASFSGIISHVEKTYAGYLVIEMIAGTPNKSNVWFSPNFSTGFTKVQTLDRGRVSRHTFSAYHSGTAFNNVIMVSEYAQNAGSHTVGMEGRLFISTDGGQSFRLIKTLNTGTNATYNNHFHAQVYDPYDARIYVSNGDHNDHAGFFYSDDLGLTWKEIPLSTYTAKYPSHHPQPTTLIATPHKIVTSPDNGLPGGVLSLLKDKKYTTINGETFEWQYDHAAYPALSGAAGKYAFSHIQKGREIYFLIPSWPGHKQAHVIGSGDNGESWYNVASLNLTGDTHPREATEIIGIDVNGFMYLMFSGTKIAKYKTAKWILS